MDLDIEMDDVVDVGPVPEAYSTDIIVGEEQEPGEVDDEPPTQAGDASQPDDRTIIPHKVHIRGLDTFKPEDIRAYVTEHFSGDRFERVEWIDDSSANLLFKSESTARDALAALSSVEVADATQLPALENIPAKPFSGKPESALQVRLAVAGDRKIVGAASRSRFYLLNPEFDPEERRRRGEFNRGKYRDRDGFRGRGRRREANEDEERAEPTFDASLYDDDEEALAKRRSPPRRRRDSPSSGDEGRYARRNRDKELFPDRKLADRNRSASPARGDDERMEVDDDLARDRAAMRNREKARAIKDRLSKDNSAKELFPSKVASPAAATAAAGSSNGAAGKAQMDQVDEGTVLSSAKLADRITARGDGSAFSIRGLATKRGADAGSGFAIKGTSVKELFPDKFGNSGKELFADKLEGRGRRRQKAEDSFY